MFNLKKGCMREVTIDILFYHPPWLVKFYDFYVFYISCNKLWLVSAIKRNYFEPNVGVLPIQSES